MARFNGKPDLTPIQIQERAKRRMLMRRGMYGMPTPKSTMPRQFKVTGEPIFKPMPLPGPPSPLELMTHLLMVFPWMRRKGAEGELRQKQESQSIKDKGVK